MDGGKVKTAIYYFSGTGNSLKVARDLAGELREAKVIPISEAIKYKEVKPEEQRVGIVYPVYMWGMPLIVANFINKLKLDKDQYVFAVATYGGMPGNALSQTAKQLEKQGMCLSAGFGVRMPGNYTPLYGAVPAEKQQEMFECEKEKVKEIAKFIQAADKTKIEKSSFLINLIFSGIIYKLGSGKMSQMDKSFWVNGKCTSCSICEQVCPVDNIKMVDGKPQWQNRCEQCMACLQWCPVEAIQYGKKTINRKRYRHPEARVEDFINAASK
ncbi:MAG: EFR1 family ferrodoxin [Candidatus Omnitrophica bacterium]|nr:EFR1 family ferrodoxin [Candidatus Omnitrophota bacterium]